MVICPIIRLSPVFVAQAAAPSVHWLGSSTSGTGTGEPPAKERLERLREAVLLCASWGHGRSREPAAVSLGGLGAWPLEVIGALEVALLPSLCHR